MTMLLQGRLSLVLLLLLPLVLGQEGLGSGEELESKEQKRILSQSPVVRNARSYVPVTLHQQSTNSAAAKRDLQYKQFSRRTARGAVIGRRSSTVTRKRGRARYMRERVEDDQSSQQINEDQQVMEYPIGQIHYDTHIVENPLELENINQQINENPLNQINENQQYDEVPLNLVNNHQINEVQLNQVDDSQEINEIQLNQIIDFQKIRPGSSSEPKFVRNENRPSRRRNNQKTRLMPSAPKNENQVKQKVSYEPINYNKDITDEQLNYNNEKIKSLPASEVDDDQETERIPPPANKKTQDAKLITILNNNQQPKPAPLGPTSNAKAVPYHSVKENEQVKPVKFDSINNNRRIKPVPSKPLNNNQQKKLEPLNPENDQQTPIVPLNPVSNDNQSKPLNPINNNNNNKQVEFSPVSAPLYPLANNKQQSSSIHPVLKLDDYHHIIFGRPDNNQQAMSASAPITPVKNNQEFKPLPPNPIGNNQQIKPTPLHPMNNNQKITPAPFIPVNNQQKQVPIRPIGFEQQLKPLNPLSNNQKAQPLKLNPTDNNHQAKLVPLHPVNNNQQHFAAPLAPINNNQQKQAPAHPIAHSQQFTPAHLNPPNSNQQVKPAPVIQINSNQQIKPVQVNYVYNKQQMKPLIYYEGNIPALFKPINNNQQVKQAPLSPVNKPTPFNFANNNQQKTTLAPKQKDLGLFIRADQEPEMIKRLMANYAMQNEDGKSRSNMAITVELPAIKNANGENQADGYALYHRFNGDVAPTATPLVTNRPPTTLKKAPLDNQPRKTQSDQVAQADSVNSSTRGDADVAIKGQPQRYEFGYRVIDNHVGSDFGHEEARSDDARFMDRVTSGRYHVLLPDGRLQKVRYFVDKDGYHALVSYVDAGTESKPEAQASR